METTTIVIVLGTAFTLLILALAGILVILAQRRRIRLELKLHETEATKQKEILEMAMRTQEKERKRIGLELHDDLGPTFSAINLRLSTIQRRIKTLGDSELSGMVKDSRDDIVQSIKKFSDVSRLLYPVILHRWGIKKALEDLVQMFSKEVEAEITLKMDLEEINNPNFMIAVYRICQEMLNNGIKHSKASNLLLNISADESKFRIRYMDDGLGFDQVGIKPGMGLESIKWRTLAFGGEHEVRTSPGHGTEIKISFDHDKISNR